ncbi:LuxR family transcriptional regulator [Promicromonospora sp. MEB111]|uniref:helix-turn-helix transcriptional regulator n=1 Tax=Promicromonospora sp. MEB111 TaxID=3040301 RepID=UPI0025509BE5|nr:LuxR family transcriptional regulator [Promicromonospora sp. MEB111]
MSDDLKWLVTLEPDTQAVQDRADDHGEHGVLSAIASGDLDTLEDLADVWWFELPARFGPELLGLLERLPATMAARRPRLLMAGVLAYQLTEARDDAQLRATMRLFELHGVRLSKRLRSFTRPGDVVAAGVLAMHAARTRGQHRTAEGIGAWVEEHLLRTDDTGALPWSGDRRVGRPGLIALNRGVTAMLAGHPAVATGHLRRAYEQAGPPPFQHFAGASACANLALLAAVRGHHAMAESWLERIRRCGPVPEWLEHHLLLGAVIARALLAIDRLDPYAAREALNQAGSAEDPGDLWPFLAAARAAYAVAFDEPVNGLLGLDAVCFAHGMGARPGPGAHPVLLRAHADLLAATGEGNRVVALAEAAGASRLLPPVARVRLLAGDTDGALTVAGRAMRDAAVTPRDALELQLVIAVVHLRSGELDEARARFLHAAELGRQGLLAPFALFPRDEMLDLCHRTGLDPRHLGITRASPDDVRHPVSGPIVLLTRRERAVLVGLAAGDSAVRIAADHGVSVNTVRTQVRKVYRKLNASNRTSALARAGQLGLIPPETPRGA